MKFQLSVLVLASIFWSGLAHGQQISEKAKMLFQRKLDSMQMVLPVKGITAAVVIPNGSIWEGASGISSENPVKPIAVGDVFATGSTTKTLMGMCILQLVDEGYFQLDDSIGKYLPDFNHVDPGISIRQLLQHTSGLKDIFEFPGFQSILLQNKGRVWKLEDVVRFFVGTPDFPKGARWKYSNTNFILLGILIEKVTGKSYHQNLTERFFEPLGLNSYRNFAFDPIPSNVAHLWLDLDGDGYQEDVHDWFTTWTSLFSSTGPAGGYFASASDLAKWMKASMSAELIVPETWIEATTTVATQFPGGATYGLGLIQRTIGGYNCFGHGGDISYSANAWYFPDLNISISVLTNDATIISWEQTPVIIALLQAYLDCQDEITQSDEVGVKTLQGLKVFPNPANDFLKMRLSDSDFQSLRRLTVLDQTTKEMHTINEVPTLNDEFTLDLSNFKNGYYYLKLENEKEAKVSIPFIVNKY
ncbi:MAG: serine hydrolase [Saprospiraceae bacterium]